MDAGALEAEADALCAAVSGASDVKSRLAAAEELAAWLERLPEPGAGGGAALPPVAGAPETKRARPVSPVQRGRGAEAAWAGLNAHGWGGRKPRCCRRARPTRALGEERGGARFFFLWASLVSLLLCGRRRPPGGPASLEAQRACVCAPFPLTDARRARPLRRSAMRSVGSDVVLWAAVPREQPAAGGVRARRAAQRGGARRRGRRARRAARLVEGGG